jgi:IS30 family transposase
MWNDGAQAKEIADKLEAPLSTIYSELRRGQDGSRLQNQRLRYSADLAQLRVQQSFERRGRRSGKREGEKRA